MYHSKIRAMHIKWKERIKKDDDDGVSSSSSVAVTWGAKEPLQLSQPLKIAALVSRCAAKFTESN